MEPNNLELAAKLATKKLRVMIAVKNIEKTGTNKFQNYDYATEAEVVREMRKALSDNGIAFTVSAEGYELSHDIPTKSGAMKHLFVKLECTLTDAETGYAETCKWLGGAADPGDKALYKAYTSGEKYFLLKTFLLPTGDDVEGDPEVDKPPSGKKAAAAAPPAKTQEQAGAEAKNLFTAALKVRAKEQHLELPKDKEECRDFIYAVMREMGAKFWPDDPTVDIESVIVGNANYFYEDLAKMMPKFDLDAAFKTFHEVPI